MSNLKYILPFRVSKKQYGLVLDANNLPVVQFNVGDDDLAEIFCKALNKQKVKKNYYLVTIKGKKSQKLYSEKEVEEYITQKMGGNSFEKDWSGIEVDEYHWVKPEKGYYSEDGYTY